MMKARIKRWFPCALFTALFLVSSFFMFNFYQALSGFIANGFREPERMLPIVSSYLLPVLCFFFWFYDRLVRPIGRRGCRCYGVIAGAWSLLNLILIFGRVGFYAQNHGLGAYGGFLGIGFPYDALAVNVGIFALSVLLEFSLWRPQIFFAEWRHFLGRRDAFSLRSWEYLLLCLFAIPTLVFLGAFISGLGALGNGGLDGRYLFLLLWVLAVPLGNLLLLACKPHLRFSGSVSRGVVLGCGILGNLLLFALLLILEHGAPGFMIRIGKPLFMIAFSVSLPVEMLVLLGLSGVSVLGYAGAILLLLVKSKRAV